MNINPQAKRILCFGDSNTYGTIPYEPGSMEKRRYSISERWTGILQQELGINYEVIEEGRGGRTIDTPGDGNEITKIGSIFLEGLLHSHGPLDLVIVMLGTNDIKESFGLTPQKINEQMKEKIISLVKLFGFKLLIVSPPSIIDELHNNFPTGSNKKIQDLNDLYNELCKKHGVYYIDIQKNLTCGSDGIHLTKDSHYILGTILTKRVKEII